MSYSSSHPSAAASSYPQQKTRDDSLLEPDENWKLNLRKQIDKIVQNVLQDAEKKKEEDLRKSPRDRVRIEEEYQSTIMTIKQAAREQFTGELERYREERAYTLGLGLTIQSDTANAPSSDQVNNDLEPDRTIPSPPSSTSQAAGPSTSVFGSEWPMTNAFSRRRRISQPLPVTTAPKLTINQGREENAQFAPRGSRLMWIPPKTEPVPQPPRHRESREMWIPPKTEPVPQPPRDRGSKASPCSVGSSHRVMNSTDLKAEPAPKNEVAWKTEEKKPVAAGQQWKDINIAREKEKERPPYPQKSVSFQTPESHRAPHPAHGANTHTDGPPMSAMLFYATEGGYRYPSPVHSSHPHSDYKRHTHHDPSNNNLNQAHPPPATSPTNPVRYHGSGYFSPPSLDIYDPHRLPPPPPPPRLTNVPLPMDDWRSWANPPAPYINQDPYRGYPSHPVSARQEENDRERRKKQEEAEWEQKRLEEVERKRREEFECERPEREAQVQRLLESLKLEAERAKLTAQAREEDARRKEEYATLADEAKQKELEVKMKEDELRRLEETTTRTAPSSNTSSILVIPDETVTPVADDDEPVSPDGTTVDTVDGGAGFSAIESGDDLRRILALPMGVDTVLGLEVTAVPAVVELLQSEIRTTASEPNLYGYRKKCTKCLRSLVNKHHVLPSSLFVNEVVKEGSHPLGGGGFSDIWKGIAGDQAVCLKVLRVHIEENQSKKDKIVREFYKETLLWTQLSHRNLLPFLGVNTTLFPQGFCLVSPWMVNGHIITFLELNPAHDRLTVITEIAAGMAYLHSLKTVHGDIKGANVLVDANARCYLADFGLAIATAETTALFNSTSSMKGSLRWMAPELFNLGSADPAGGSGGRGDKSSKLGRDLYAYACTVLEIITGKPPFPDLKDTMVMFQVAVNGTRPPRPDGVDWCPDNIWGLIQLCWAQEIKLRPNGGCVHSYLEGLVDARTRGMPWEMEFPQSVVGS